MVKLAKTKLITCPDFDQKQGDGAVKQLEGGRIEATKGFIVLIYPECQQSD